MVREVPHELDKGVLRLGRVGPLGIVPVYVCHTLTVEAGCDRFGEDKEE